MTLDNRTRELIAIGASVTANCQPCLSYHVGKARELGVDEAEIEAALRVGRVVRKGAADKMDAFAAALDESPRPAIAAADGCGCES
ncbi:MAG: carboxymuconolactone decarboxylase family protein [Chloroflexota bacterium]|nr:MAG: carboxymuconolactone decarboxylase family protein [Chloroflexota bacterium]